MLELVEGFKMNAKPGRKIKTTTKEKATRQLNAPREWADVVTYVADGKGITVAQVLEMVFSESEILKRMHREVPPPARPALPKG